MNTDMHFSRGRIEEGHRTSDAIKRARSASSAGQAAVAQARDRLGTPDTGKVTI